MYVLVLCQKQDSDLGKWGGGGGGFVRRASETLTGVTQWKIGDVCLFIYIYVWTYVCHFVF